ncbi:MAG: indolepyruvate oxidoreductase subunit beta [Pseudomonadota bacterium]
METTRLILVAVGGQGNLLASRVIGEAALLSDIPVRMSEIHGMAQRGGVVESAILFGDVKSTIISDGEADVMVGFEPLETLRALNKCNSKTVVVANLSPLSPFTVTTGSGVYPGLEELQALIRAKTAKLIAFNAVELAERAGNILSVNMVLLGALVQTGKIPLSADTVKAAIIARTKSAFLESNMKAFELGFSAAEAIG